MHIRLLINLTFRGLIDSLSLFFILLQIGSAVSLSFFSSSFFFGGGGGGVGGCRLVLLFLCLSLLPVFFGGTGSAISLSVFFFLFFFPPVFFVLFPPSICHETVCASFSLNLVHRDEVQAVELLRVCSMGGGGGDGDAP